MEENLHSKITEVLMGLGAPNDAKGFGYIVEILVNAIYNDVRITNRCQLCENWGTVFGNTATQVERNLYYIKEICFETKTELFEKVFKNLRNLSVYGFLETIRIYIMENVEEELWRI